MRKLLAGVCILSCLAKSALARGDDKAPAEGEARAEPGAEARPEEEKPRPPSAELGFVLVPWGMAYTRAGLGVSLQYKAPLVKRPGILWDTTNITAGVRDFYGLVNNSLAAFVEVTPIAFFKLQLSAAYDSLIVPPFSGGARILTAAGQKKLADGLVERGNPEAVDWVEGLDNREVFSAPVGGDGLRLKIQPTLQAKVGPVGMQYNFTADFNVYRVKGHDRGAIVHDTFTFTLRKLVDFGQVHELVAVVEIPGIRDELNVGLIGSYYRVGGTGLDNLNLNALVFYRPRWAWLGQRVSPWIAGQAGTNLRDPMHQYDFSWVLALGLDLRLFGGPRA